MRRIFLFPITLLILAAVPVLLTAKGPVVKITIGGPELNAPLEITNGDLHDFNPYAGPGVRINGIEQTDGFIVNWQKGNVAELPPGLHRYEVSFYLGYPDNGLAAVVSYAVDPATNQGYVYLPGPDDEQYRQNRMHRPGHDFEGHWLRATSAWEKFARPLIAQATRTSAP